MSLYDTFKEIQDPASNRLQITAVLDEGLRAAEGGYSSILWII